MVWRSPRGTPISRPKSGHAPWPCRAPWRRGYRHTATRGDPVATTEEVLAAEPTLTVDYVAVADLDGPTLAAAVRVGATRLIDNVRLVDEP